MKTCLYSSTHNLCFEQKFEKYQRFFIWKFSLYGSKWYTSMTLTCKYVTEDEKEFKICKGANSYLLEKFPFEKGSKNFQLRVLSRWCVSICLKFTKNKNKNKKKKNKNKNKKNKRK